MIDDWEARLAAHWATLDDADPDGFIADLDALAGELGADDPVAYFERAAARDSLGHPDLAVPLYRRALDLGLTGLRRRRAVIQMASSLRNLGVVDDAVRLLREEKTRGSDELDDAVHGFLALCLVDAGQAREAASLALAALAPHLPRYQRSLGRYARALLEPDDDASQALA